MKHHYRMAAVFCVVLTLLLSVSTAFAGGKTEGAAGGAKLKVGYVCKFLNIDWFQNEEKGLKDFCALNGAEYLGGVDANNDLEKFLAAVDQLIAKGANALALVVPNPSIGASVAEKCRAANVAMVTIDDPFKDSAGKQIPHTGMNGIQAGNIGGTEAAKYMKSKGYDKINDGSVFIYSMSVDQIPPCKDRNDGFTQALKKELPGWDFTNNFQRIDFSSSGNVVEEAIKSAAAVFQSHPKAKIWVVYSCDDAGAVGASLAMTERKMDTGSICIPQNGASPVITEWKKGNPYIKLSVTQFSWAHGFVGGQLLYEQVINKKAVAENTLLPAMILTPAKAKELYPNDVVSFGRPANMDDIIAKKQAGKYYTIADFLPNYMPK
jgi:L-arabinose transport system substrate-binding protein